MNLEIDSQYPIPSDSKVELRSSSLLGGMVANVIPGTSTQNARSGVVLPGSVAKGIFDQIDALQNSAGRRSSGSRASSTTRRFRTSTKGATTCGS